MKNNKKLNLTPRLVAGVIAGIVALVFWAQYTPEGPRLDQEAPAKVQDFFQVDMDISLDTTLVYVSFCFGSAGIQTTFTPEVPGPSTQVPMALDRYSNGCYQYSGQWDNLGILPGDYIVWVTVTDPGGVTLYDTAPWTVDRVKIYLPTAPKD